VVHVVTHALSCLTLELEYPSIHSILNL